MAGSKKGDTQQEVIPDELDNLLQSSTKKLSAEQACGYFLLALFISGLPAFLFHSVFELTVQEHGLFLIGFTGLSAAALSVAYKNVAANTFVKLQGSRKYSTFNSKKLNVKKEDIELTQEKTSENEAVAWSFFLNNLVFALSFLFFAFYVFKNINILYNYSLSMTLSAALTWQLSSSVAK